jgi:hypothetical protein
MTLQVINDFIFLLLNQQKQNEGYNNYSGERLANIYALFEKNLCVYVAIK